MKKVLLCLLLLIPIPSLAATYIVDTAVGMDTNTCMQAQTAATAKATISGTAGGISCMNAGDTLQIRAGTYNEQIYYAFFPFGGTPPPTVPNGMSSSAQTTVQGYPGDAHPVIKYVNSSDNALVYMTRANFAVFDSIDLDASGLTAGMNNFIYYVDGSQNVTVTNVSITGVGNNTYGNGISIGDNNAFSAVQHIHFTNIKFSGTEGLGCTTNPGGHAFYISMINFASSDIVIDKSEFTGWNVPPSIPACGNNYIIHAFTSTCPSAGCLTNGVTVSNSYFHDNQGPAVLIGSGANDVVYNNIFVNNGTSSTVGISGVDIGFRTADNMQVYNNTFYNNATGLYAVGSSGFGTVTNAKVRNNILWMNGQSDAINTNLTSTSGYLGTPNLQATNPSFVNQAGNNFHLTSGSVARNVGVNLSSIFTTDKDGNTRPPVVMWDDGAYQFIPMGCSNTTLGNGITCIVSKSGGSTNGNTVSLTGITAAGSTSAIVVISQNVAGTPCTPASTPTNTWVPLSVSSDGTRKNQVFAASPPVAVSNSMSVSCNGTGTAPAIAFSSYTGLLTSQTPTDQTVVGNNGAGSTTLTLGPITPINATQLLFVAWNENAGLSLTPNNGFTQIESVLHTATNAGVGFGVNTIGPSAASSVTLTAASSDIINGTFASFATNLLNVFTITQQPTTISGGSTFSPPIAGSLVSTRVGDSIAISSVSGTATPTGTLSVTTASGGAFSFPGVGATGTPSTGNIWKVCDSSSSLNPCLNLNGFNLLGTFTITQQPTNVYSGYGFSPTISGSISTGVAGDTIVLSAVSGTASPTGMLSVVTTAGGVFSFPGVGATGTASNGNIWKVRDSTNSLISDLNLSAFNLLSPFTTITQQPTSINGGTTFPSAIAGTVTPGAANSYTLSLNVPCGTVAFTGTLTVLSNMTSGAFTYPGVGATGTGINCVGKIHNNSNSAVADILTNAFAVCTPNHLTFISQPMNASIGSSLGNVSVGVYDTGNNLCASDSGRSITFTNTSGQCMGMTLNGTTTGNNSNGTFLSSNLNETGAAGTCSLHAASSGLTPTDSNLFTVVTATGTATRIRIK